MAGVTNNVEKQFNLKHIVEGQHYTVRLKPGFNIVPDEIWEHFEGCDYVKDLAKQKLISFGSEEDEMELDADESAEAETKVAKSPYEGKKKTTKNTTRKKSTKK